MSRLDLSYWQRAVKSNLIGGGFLGCVPLPGRGWMRLLGEM